MLTREKQSFFEDFYREAAKHLTQKERLLLECYLENRSLKETVKKVKVKRHNILASYMFLGQKLALFKFMNFNIIIKKYNKEYLEAYNDLFKQLKAYLKKGFKKERCYAENKRRSKRKKRKS